MTLVFAVFLLLLVLGIPIGYIMGLSSLVGLFQMGGPDFLEPVATSLHSGTSGYILVAVPFFILISEFLNRSGMTNQLVAFANSLFGHLRGGLSHVNIFVSILFAGLTGTAVTDTVAVGGILIPAMKKQGYTAAYAAAVTAAASVIGPVIPPSIVMVLYASILRLSVPGLFAAALVPGLLCGLALLVQSLVLSVRRGYPQSKRASLREVWGTAYRAMPPMGIGIILLGITDVSEAAAVGALYALLLGWLGYRSLSIRAVWESLLNTVVLSGVIFLLIGSAAALGWFITLSGVVEKTGAMLAALHASPLLVLTLVDAFILIVCMFIDVIPAALVLGPVLSPAMAQLGINPIHFAMIMMLGLNIGNATPPMGMSLMTASRIARIPYESCMKNAAYFIAAEVGVLMIVTYFPILSLWLPRLLGYAD
jgi:tripartite ATP-independent transporter DctM subunit